MPQRPARHQPAGHCARLQRSSQERDQERDQQPHRKLLKTARWQRFRAAFLQAHPICADCLARGGGRPATDVHHVRKLALHVEDLLDPEQVIALCSECHDKRTRAGE
jgi:5-methylcytosine-specific restriction protein A